MCPNIGECWEEREATFLILGDRCTRRCGFCDVMTAQARIPSTRTSRRGSPRPSQRWACGTSSLTGVARDDLPDGGARIWAATIRAVREAVPGLRRRGAAHRLQGRRARHRHRDRGRARRVRAQPGDGPTAARPDPPRVRLRPLARGAPDRQAPPRRPDHEVEPDPRAWARRPSEVAEALARPRATPAAISSRWASTCSRRSCTCRSTAGSRPTSSPSTSAWARRWASRTWRRGRSFGARYHAGKQFQRALPAR